MTTFEDGDDFTTVMTNYVELGKEFMFIGLPAVVVEYDPVEQCITAQPVMRGLLGTGNRVEHDIPPLLCVPVIWPGGGPCAHTFPLAKGDAVMIHFSDRFAEDWLLTGKINLPLKNPRRFDINDAFASPRIRPFSNPLKSASATDMVLGEDDGEAPLQLRLKPGESYMLSDGTSEMGVEADGTLVMQRGSTKVELGTDGGVVMESGGVTLGVDGDGVPFLKRGEKEMFATLEAFFFATKAHPEIGGAATTAYNDINSILDPG